MLQESAYISLLIQFIVGIIDAYGLNIKIPENKRIFTDLLKVELGVQSVEFIFYAWMVYNFKNISNITPHRYIDWCITTPVMLLTLMAYLDGKSPTLIHYIKNNKKLIINVVILNLLMLLFGLMGELGFINYYTAIAFGFVPFIYYFKLIYDKYNDNMTISKDKRNLFNFFFIVWSLYGVAAFLPYIMKNTAYNILDLFAKNLFGLILVYIIWSNRIN